MRQKLKRYQYLMRDQMSKGIPQALKNFIEVSKELYDKIIEELKNEEDKVAAFEMKMKNFNMFLD